MYSQIPAEVISGTVQLVSYFFTAVAVFMTLRSPCAAKDQRNSTGPNTSWILQPLQTDLPTTGTCGW